MLHSSNEKSQDNKVATLLYKYNRVVTMQHTAVFVRFVTLGSVLKIIVLCLKAYEISVKAHYC